MFRYSVSSYSFDQAIRAGKMTQFDCIAKAKEMGFDAVEFTEIAGAGHAEQCENARAYRAEAARVGIAISSYVVGAALCRETDEEVAAEVARLKKEVDLCALLGAGIFRHDVCPPLGKHGRMRSFDAMLPTIAAAAREVTAYAAEQGIRTCTENHGYVAQDSDRVERLFNAVAHDNYGLLVDVGNFICADEDPLRAVSRVAPYAVHVHVKDMVLGDRAAGSGCFTRAGVPFCGAVLGEGDVPVAACLRAVRRAGYEGYVTLEYEAPEECLSGIARGFENLRRMVDALN